MEVTILFGLGLVLLIAVFRVFFRKDKSDATYSESEDESIVPNVLGQVVIGCNPTSPLVTIAPTSEIGGFEQAKPLDVESDKSIGRLSALCQAVPSLLVAGEASGKRLMEVVINGELVRAADGNGLRAFAMNGTSITEHARLFKVDNLKAMINAAAIWQIASVIVAQKHLADISKKLDEIKVGVEHISQFLENQRKSRLLAAYDYLGQVYLSIKGGDLPNSSRIVLEDCERDLLEIQHHLEMEYRQKIDKKVKHVEMFGTEELETGIGKKISELDDLAGDIALCLKTRIAAWHVLSLFPGDPQLKVARRICIQKSIDAFAGLAQHLEKSMEIEIAAVHSLWNKGSTLDSRKRSLKSRCMIACRELESHSKKSSEQVMKSEHVLLENDHPTRLYLQFNNGELIGAREAA